MDQATRRLDDHLSLEEVLQVRGVPRRDCRACAAFDPDPEGRAFGFCTAHDAFVKLYHTGGAGSPAGGWHSQCQFATLRLVREVSVAAGGALFDAGAH